jgi:hypothetical protein
MARKVLLISYHFPPSPEVGGLRAANFAKHLPQLGWTPVILTIKDKYLKNLDTEKLNYLGPVTIVKAGRLPKISQLYVTVKQLLNRLGGRRDALATGTEPRSGPSKPRERTVESLSAKVRRYVLSFLSLPDEERNWTWPAVIRAIREVRRGNIDCILTSSPPYSVHMVGLLVRWLTGVPWVADFRDPWMTGGSKKLYVTSRASLGIERWLEWKVVQRADLVVTNTEMLCDAFRKSYGTRLSDRFVCLTNGFDGEFFSQFGHIPKDERFTIIYAGTLYFGRTPEPVFKAVHELIRESQVNPESIRIRLVGQCGVMNGRPVEEVVRAYGLAGVVDVCEAVSYRCAIEMVKTSHLALLLAPNQPYQIPAKAYDYMGTGTRILALAESGATCDLVHSTGVGAAFRPSDVAGIKDFILRSMLSSMETGSPKHQGAVSSYEIRSITRRLARSLDALCHQDKQIGEMRGRADAA